MYFYVIYNMYFYVFLIQDVILIQDVLSWILIPVLNKVESFSNEARTFVVKEVSNWFFNIANRNIIISNFYLVVRSYFFFNFYFILRKKILIVSLVQFLGH